MVVVGKVLNSSHLKTPTGLWWDVCWGCWGAASPMSSGHCAHGNGHRLHPVIGFQLFSSSPVTISICRITE